MAGTRIGMNGYAQFFTPNDLIIYSGTGKSFSEVLIIALTNPHYDKRLFISLQWQAQIMGRTRSCSEYQNKKQIVYTTCSTHVLSLQFLCIKLVIQ